MLDKFITNNKHQKESLIYQNFDLFSDHYRQTNLSHMLNFSDIAALLKFLAYLYSQYFDFF